MAFGFFKKDKSIHADYIYTNAKIYTLDEENPWAEAVACKDGRIIAVGKADVAETFAGEETEIIDLGGDYLLSGFIDINGVPAYNCFKDCYHEFTESGDFGSFLGAVATLTEPDFTGVADTTPRFIIARNLSIPEDLDGKTLRAELDERSPETPLVVLLPEVSGVIMNSLAAEAVKVYMEENEILQANLNVILDALDIIDYEEIRQNMINISKEYCEKGFTSVVNNGHMEFFDNLYTNMLIEIQGAEGLKQRFFGKLAANAPADPTFIQEKLRQKMVMCQEMDGYVNESGLLIKVSDKFDDLETQLSLMCKAAAESGFDVKVCVDDDESARIALKVLYEIQSKGYRKSVFVLSHHTNFTEDERINTELGSGIIEACPINMDYVTGAEAGNITEAVETLTFDGAVELGLADELGTVEVGKRADFAVFGENPFDCGSIKLFRRLNARKTIVAGEIVYDEDEDVEEEWYSILVNQQY